MALSLRSLLIMLGLGLLLANCSKWKVNPYDLIPQVKTGTATNPATTSVQVDCRIETLGPNSLKEFGVVFSSSNQQPTTSDTKIPANGTTGNAQVMLNGLQPNTTYYYRTYAINDKGIVGYGEIMSFKTATVIADVRTLDLTGSPGSNSFQIQVQVMNSSTVTLKEYGVVYSPTSQTPTVSDNKIPAVNATGATVPVSVTNLLPNTTYYYRAYAITSTGDVSYGDVRQAKTGEPVPSVETLDVVGTPSSSSAVVQSQVTNASQVTLKEYGVVYSPSNQTPSVGDSKAAASGVTGASATIVLTNLEPNKKYYYRSYAINKVDTVRYGSVKTFQTGAAPVAQKPDVETVDAVAITATKANLVLKVKSAPTTIDKYGICFSKTNSDPKPDNGSVVMSNREPGSELKLNSLYGLATDIYNLPLEPNTEYYYRAYAITIPVNGKAEPGYGEVKKFKTLPVSFVWRRLNNFPGAARANSDVFVIDNKAYIAGGDLAPESLTDEVWQFDPSNETWTRKANLPLRGFNGAAFAVDGVGYLTGLFNNNSIKSEILIYNPKEDKWTSRTDARLNRAFCNVCVLGKKAYIGIGLIIDAAGKTVDQSSILEYNTETSTSAIIPLTGMGTRLAGVRDPAMVSYDGKCVIGGGTLVINNTYSHPTATVEFSPNATTKFDAKADMPQPRINTGVTIGNRAFAVSVDDNKLFEYKNGQWLQVSLSSQGPQPPSLSGRTLFSIGNTIYLCFGSSMDGNGVRSQDVWALIVE
ncbi:kelch repeat-containing protein [Spirosoma soli]|uniref:Kelch repeat-containing protein n=1 Tax=Spirosoma soli TaxID=1770529 RepID=A0ABW5M4C6_9BACT